MILFILIVKGFSFSTATGDPRPSKKPPSLQKFKQNPSGYDRRGGGVVIPCTYTVEIRTGSAENVAQKIKDFLKGLGEDTDETLMLDSESDSCPY